MNRDLAKKRGLHLLAAAFAIFYVFVSLFPLLFSLLSSFKNNTTIYAAPFALPEALDLENYRYALGGTSLLRGMANSLLYSVLSIALIILMALLVSYAYRVRVPGYRLVFLFFIAGMALPVHAMLVPLASIINQLKLSDTLAGIVGVYAATNVSLAVFLLNGYMKGISRELDEAIDLADKKGVVIGEAMTIYHMPIYKKLKEILESGKLGKVNLITMNFGSFKEYDMNNRFFNKNLAGGAMLDIGVYALSFIWWFMDSKPDQLLSQVKPAPTGVDEQAGLLLMNQEGQMASVMLSLHSKQPKRGMVSCEKGYIEIMEYPRAWEARITYTDSGETEVIQTGEYADALAYELADMEKAIRGDAECMHLDYTKDVMDMMTEFRKEWGFQYPEEM